MIAKKLKNSRFLKMLKIQKVSDGEPTMGGVPLDLLFVKRERLVADVAETVLGTAITY